MPIGSSERTICTKERRFGEPQFCVIERVEAIDDAGLIRCYGIRANYCQSGETIEIYNLSSRRSKVEHMVKLLKKGSVSAVHLRDVLEDFLISEDW